MTKRFVAAAIFVACLFPASALGHTTIVLPPETGYPFQHWIDTSYVPTPDITLSLVFSNEPCGDSMAVACTNSQTIEIRSKYVNERGAFLHEIGHAWDAERMQDWQRARFMLLIHRPDAGWTNYGTEEEQELGFFAPEPPIEWFAEAYALCARLSNLPPHTLYNVSGGVIGAPALRKTCVMIRRTPTI